MIHFTNYHFKILEILVALLRAKVSAAYFLGVAMITPFP